MARPSKFTADQRAAGAARVIDGGEKVAAVAADLGAPTGTVSSWVRAERKRRGGGTTPEPAAAGVAAGTDELDSATRREHDATARRYINYVTAPKPPRNRERVEAALADVTARITANGFPDTMARLRAITQRIELERELSDVQAVTLTPEDVEKLEAGFIAVGAAWAARHGFPAAALREIGVPRRVCKAAGIA